MYRPGYVEPVIPMVSSLGPWGPSLGILATVSGLTSQTWLGASVMLYSPIIIPTRCVARRAWWVNGTVVSASYNIGVGIYASNSSGEPSSLIVQTASTAQGTATQVQFADLTDTSLAPGAYWLAIVASNGAAEFRSINLNSYEYFNATLCFKEASVTPGSLPATATPAEADFGKFAMFGFATTASP